MTQSFDILADPRVPVGHDDLREQFQLLIAIRDRLSETHATANRIADLRRQTELWRTRPDVESQATRLDDLDRQLSSIDQELIERTPGLSYAHPIRLNAKLAALGAMVGSADSAPTQQSRAVFVELSQRLDDQLERLRHLLDVDLANVNDALRDLEVPMIGALPFRP